MAILEDQRARNDQIIKALTEKGARLPCSRCGRTNFEIAGETSLPLQTDPNSFTLGGPSVPVAIVVCSHCGNASQHALGILGLMKR